MKTVTLPSGEKIPALGQGTWRMGERSAGARKEVEALQAGIDLGLTLIDTAEMYGEGGAEKIVAKAIDGRRDGLFIVSKVYPHNATRDGTIAACERSLSRLKIEQIDLYLLHWRGGNDIGETLQAFEQLVDDGKIRHFGVSNFDTDDMREWADLPGGKAVAANQILYNLGRRWCEWSTLPWCQENHVPVMAYTPLEPVSASGVNPVLDRIARKRSVSPAAVAIAWVLRQPGVLTIPKASSRTHLKENIAALDIELDASELDALDTAFPPPAAPAPIEMI